MDYNPETDQMNQQLNNDARALESRIHQAENVSQSIYGQDNVGPPIEDQDGTKVGVLDRIPFEQDYPDQANYITRQANNAAAHGADEMEYILPKGYVAPNGGEVKDIDMIKLGFQKHSENAASSTWRMKVIR